MSRVDSVMIRCVQILDAAGRAQLTPIPLHRLHALAYLADALGVVWGFDSDYGEVRKRRGLPYIPQLQHAFDRLVWMGLIRIHENTYEPDDFGIWRSVATSTLDPSSSTMLDALQVFPDEVVRSRHCLEVALGVSRNGDLAAVFAQDASYSNPSASLESLIDLAPIGELNRSAGIAARFGKLLPDYAEDAGGQVALYLNHLGSLERQHAG